MQDMCVDSTSIDQTNRRILQSIETIDHFNDFMIKKLLLSHDEFASINYDRFKEDVKKMNLALKDMSERLDIMKDFLKDLSSCLEEYMGCSY